LTVEFFWEAGCEKGKKKKPKGHHPPEFGRKKKGTWERGKVRKGGIWKMVLKREGKGRPKKGNLKWEICTLRP